MIELKFEQSKFTIDEEYRVHPSDDLLNNMVQIALSNYNSPAQGFKTSFVAEELEKMGTEIIKVFDEDMENSKDDVVY